MVEPVSDSFSGFVFKIQANMDPHHRDRMAFLRIVSGKFTRDMPVTHVRTGKKLRLSNSNNVFGRERVSVDEAYPGDVIGVVGRDLFAIGDTVSEDPGLRYDEIPRFAPECFAYVRNPNPSDYKRFQDGVEQLVQEGLVHLFVVSDSNQRTLVLGAVGPLQFDLVKFRLEAEYKASSVFEKAPWTVARWVSGGSVRSLAPRLPFKTALAHDPEDREVLLFEGEWHMNYFLENCPTKFVLADSVPVHASVA
jgi:peptide chain release factor 3